MVPEIKYFGEHSLEALITLTKNSIAKKADMLQFNVMPDPIKYLGKVVQYVGVSDVAFTRSHFYYSNGIKWTEEDISGEQTTQIEMVTVLPSWTNADPQILYILKNSDGKMGLYVKNPGIANAWYTVESSGSFSVVAVLPQWADADPSTIYFKADGNVLTGYIKKTGTIGAWYTVGGGAEIVVDTVLSASSTNPVQNKVIYSALQDILAQVSSIYHYKGSCTAAELPGTADVGDVWNLSDASEYGPIGTNVAWDGTEWDALGGDLILDPVPTDGSQHSVMSGGVYDALEAKEDVANKVTELDATSTDDQYPSAKAVYDALEDLEPIPPGFVQNVDTTMQPVEDGKVMRISKAAFDALAQRDPDVMYYLDEEHDLIDAKPTCRDVNGDLVPGQKIVELTKAQYDALATKDPDTYYMVNDDNDPKTWYPKPDWANMSNISNAAFNTGYACPADGMLILRLQNTSTTSKILTVNDIEVITVSALGGEGNTRPVITELIVSQSDVIKITSATANLTNNSKFVPWKS